MQRIAVFVSTVLILSASLGIAQRKGPAKETTYKSPDGFLFAIVRCADQPEATDECEVRLQTATGKVVATRNYRSTDGEHGYGIVKSQWTPDSQFFVYSLASSGGHQAWHTPVQFFSRKSGRIGSLDAALNDSVADPHFSVQAPDKVTVELYFANKTSTVSLSLLAKKHSSNQ